MSGPSADEIEAEGKRRKKHALDLLVRAKGTANQLVALAMRDPALLDAMFTYGDHRQKKAAQRAISEGDKRQRKG